MRFLGLYIKVSSNGSSVDPCAIFLQWAKMTPYLNGFSTDKVY